MAISGATSRTISTFPRARSSFPAAMCIEARLRLAASPRGLSANAFWYAASASSNFPPARTRSPFISHASRLAGSAANTVSTRSAAARRSPFSVASRACPRSARTYPGLSFSARINDVAASFVCRSDSCEWPLSASTSGCSAASPKSLERVASSSFSNAACSNSD